MSDECLVVEFHRLAGKHKEALLCRAARLILAGSVLRVFEAGSDHDMYPVLVKLEVDRLPGLGGQEEFRHWFEVALGRLARAILKKNRDRASIHPGYKWGHATKVLTLFLRELVLSSRYFTDAEARRIEPWLYTPLDRVALRRLNAVGYPTVWAIKDIDTPKLFYRIQNDLGEAAAVAGASRIWFDDNWLDG